MGYLEEENIAAIIETIRSEKWGVKIFPLYFNHPNSLVRYEVACSESLDEQTLFEMLKDKELIVRQAAKKNLIKRQMRDKFKAETVEVVASPPQEADNEKKLTKIKTKKKKGKEK